MCHISKIFFFLRICIGTQKLLDKTNKSKHGVCMRRYLTNAPSIFCLKLFSSSPFFLRMQYNFRFIPWATWFFTVIFSSSTPPNQHTHTCPSYHPTLSVGFYFSSSNVRTLSCSSPSQCKFPRLKYSPCFSYSLDSIFLFSLLIFADLSFLWEVLLKKPTPKATLNTLPISSHGILYYSGRKL